MNHILATLPLATFYPPCHILLLLLIINTCYPPCHILPLSEIDPGGRPGERRHPRGARGVPGGPGDAEEALAL